MLVIQWEDKVLTLRFMTMPKVSKSGRDMSMQTAEYHSEEEDEPIQHMPSPDSKPCIADCGLPPSLGMKTSLGSLFGKPARVGMSKKVFSMADLSSAVDFADSEDAGKLPGRKAHTEHKKVNLNPPTIEDDDDDIGVDSDAYSDSDDEELLVKPTLHHTAGKEVESEGGEEIDPAAAVQQDRTLCCRKQAE